PQPEINAVPQMTPQTFIPPTTSPMPGVAPAVIVPQPAPQPMHQPAPQPAPQPSEVEKTKPNTNHLDQDGDGVFNHYDRCPDTPRGVPVGKNGCTMPLPK
ncbi:hypothetical protein ACQZV8_21490, partial [Magnetococcales bacterium HHB-1]